MLRHGVAWAGRGIFTRDDVPAGTPLLSVPLSLCFRAQREEAISVPGASWGDLTTGVVAGWARLQTFYEKYPLPWEVRLGIALLDAQEGNAANEFWGARRTRTPLKQDVCFQIAWATPRFPTMTLLEWTTWLDFIPVLTAQGRLAVVWQGSISRCCLHRATCRAWSRWRCGYSQPIHSSPSS